MNVIVPQFVAQLEAILLWYAALKHMHDHPARALLTISQTAEHG